MSRVRIGVGIVSVMLVFLFLVGCSNPLHQIQNRLEPATEIKNKEAAVDETTAPEIPEEEPVGPVRKEMSVTLAAVGDVLIHKPVYQDAQTGPDTYDFTPMLELVLPYLQDADLTFANSESIIGGQVFGVSTYPTFNSPFEVGDALKRAGVDVVSMANNHTLDKGEKAVLSAIDYWNEIDMAHTGAFKSEQDRDRITTIERNGITFSFVAYTYGTNGLRTPKGKEYLVNYIDREKIQSDLEQARSVSDVAVISLHFGNEYERMPNEAQKELAKFAVDNGADIVLGHHPHVLQPAEWVTAADGRKAFVIYSLGNFLSSQDKLYRRIGGIVNIQVDKVVEDGVTMSVELKNPAFTPTFVRFHNWRGFKLIPMKQVTPADLNNPEQMYDEIKQHMTQWIPEMRIQ